jgi:hypothetical protein
MSGLFQHLAEEMADGLFVVDDQNRSHGFSLIYEGDITRLPAVCLGRKWLRPAWTEDGLTRA